MNNSEEVPIDHLIFRLLEPLKIQLLRRKNLSRRHFEILERHLSQFSHFHWPFELSLLDHSYDLDMNKRLQRQQKEALVDFQSLLQRRSLRFHMYRTLSIVVQARQLFSPLAQVEFFLLFGLHFVHLYSFQPQQLRKNKFHSSVLLKSGNLL